MLRQHVERADAQRRRVLRVLGDGVERGAAFEHFETVGRHQHALRGLVHAVIGAADTLQQPRGAFRRSDIDDQIDIAPIDAEIERRGTNDSAQSPGCHRGFDLAPLRHVERAVMQRDREIVVVDVPELLKNALRLAAGIDEDERGLVRGDEPVDLVERVPRRMAGPGQPLARIEHGDVRRGAALRDDEIGAPAARCAALLWHHEARQFFGLRHGRRESDAGEIGGKTKQPRQAEREKIAALGDDERMQFVEDHAFERAEQIRRIGGGQ